MNSFRILNGCFPIITYIMWLTLVIPNVFSNEIDARLNEIVNVSTLNVNTDQNQNNGTKKMIALNVGLKIILEIPIEVQSTEKPTDKPKNCYKTSWIKKCISKSTPEIPTTSPQESSTITMIYFINSSLIETEILSSTDGSTGEIPTDEATVVSYLEMSTEKSDAKGTTLEPNEEDTTEESYETTTEKSNSNEITTDESNSNEETTEEPNPDEETTEESDADEKTTEESDLNAITTEESYLQIEVTSEEFVTEASAMEVSTDESNWEVITERPNEISNNENEQEISTEEALSTVGYIPTDETNTHEKDEYGSHSHTTQSYSTTSLPTDGTERVTEEWEIGYTEESLSEYDYYEYANDDNSQTHTSSRPTKITVKPTSATTQKNTTKATTAVTVPIVGGGPGQGSGWPG